MTLALVFALNDVEDGVVSFHLRLLMNLLFDEIFFESEYSEPSEYSELSEGSELSEARRAISFSDP